MKLCFVLLLIIRCLEMRYKIRKLNLEFTLLWKFTLVSARPHLPTKNDGMLNVKASACALIVLVKTMFVQIFKSSFQILNFEHFQQLLYFFPLAFHVCWLGCENPYSRRKVRKKTKMKRQRNLCLCGFQMLSPSW